MQIWRGAPINQSLSIIVVALNEEKKLGLCLESLNKSPSELIVIDGGSCDQTALIASRFNVHLLSTPANRGLQLATGGAASKSKWLMFIHGDTVLGPNWQTHVSRFMNEEENKKVAGVFRYRNDIHGYAGRFLEQYVALRTFLGLPYGDQGLLISRHHYELLGGFKKVPIMEDVDIIRRIGRKNIKVLPAHAMTSGDRYQGGRFLFRGIKNILCLGLYFLGVSPHRIVKFYK